MRVLLTHRPGGAYGHISESWLNAFRAAGHVAERWDGAQTSWDAFAPDLYLGCSGHRQPIPAQRAARVAIHVNPYGTTVPGIDEPRPALDWTLAQRPDAVFGYGFEHHRHYWANWEAKHGVPWVPMANAGDPTLYKPLGDGSRPIDIGYVGGYWPYKAQNMDRFLLPLLRSTPLACDVRGWGAWPPGVLKGGIDDADVPLLFSLSKVCPCVSEPHTAAHGIDLPERVFKVVLCGAVAIHDPVAGLDRVLPSVVMANGPDDYAYQCQLWAQPAMTSKRAELAERQRREVLAGHTYFHRLAGLLARLGFAAEAAGMLETATSYV